MKLGFIGNMNNYPFMVAKSLKEKGYDVVFYVVEKEKLCRPEFRYNEITFPYPDWIKDVSELKIDFFSFDEYSKEFLDLVDQINQCNIVFLNGYSIRLSKHFNVPHICVFTGSDLTNLANFNYASSYFIGKLKDSVNLSEMSKFIIRKFIENKYLIKSCERAYKLMGLKCDIKYAFSNSTNLVKSIFFLSRANIALIEQIKLQRDSIRSALGFFYAVKGVLPDGDQLLKEIGVNEENRIIGLMVDRSLSVYKQPKKNKDVRIFNVARLTWIKPESNNGSEFSQIDFKGNDIMIKGLAAFYKKHKVKMQIILIRKGKDVEQTFELAKTEGVDHLIVWKDELTQAQVREEYEHADIVFDQLGDAAVSMGGLEAMAVGRPVIANSNPLVYDSVNGMANQICQASTVTDVYNWLEKLVLDEDQRIKKGISSYQYVLEKFSSDVVIERIEKVMLKNKCAA